jgi:hypothetical protein
MDKMNINAKVQKIISIRDLEISFDNQKKDNPFTIKIGEYESHLSFNEGVTIHELFTDCCNYRIRRRYTNE